MTKPILEAFVNNIELDDLPSRWKNLDTINFSNSKKLFEFQQKAVINIIKCLYLFFKEDEATNTKFFERYINNGLDKRISTKLHLKLSNFNADMIDILQEYYPTEDESISFDHFIQRAAFWMATGSGKTLVAIKLIELLKELSDLGEIPKKDILILTYRDDLITQFKRHVDEFNEISTKRGFKIDLVELKEYDRIKKESLRPYFNNLTVFYYRSDLIGDDQKEKIIDFRNYQNEGNWYLILDEAHKGDKDDSKRQIYNSILSRNGFLFNFSATFVDPRDLITTVYNFNLEKFVTEGYSKHLYLFQEELTSFKEEDYNQDEKQKIVLKTLILLTYLKKIYSEVKETSKRQDIYWEPLMLVLVNTVQLSTIREKPDLKLFFEEIEKIANGDIEEELYNEAVKEIRASIRDWFKFIYEKTTLKIDREKLQAITKEDILKYIFNADSFSGIEVLVIPEKRKEVVLKLKASDKPFALIKIGDAIKWIKDNLKGYEFTESFEDKSFFENIDQRDELNLLMGSRAFYEGWDSNRPNLILYINIGTGTKAKKFVTQSVGRGVRVEPFKNKRRRLLTLYNQKQDEKVYETVKKIIQPLETLFIFGTSKKSLNEVIQTLKVGEETRETLELSVNRKALAYTLLIPTYRELTQKLWQINNPQKFLISKSQLEMLRRYFTELDHRILAVQHEIPLEILKHIISTFDNEKKYYRIDQEQTIEIIPINYLVDRLIDHFNLKNEEFNEWKALEEEIIHFKKISVALEVKEEIQELKEKINKVGNWKPDDIAEEERQKRYLLGEIDENHYVNGSASKELFKDLIIKNNPHHYYLPLILTNKEQIDYVKHAISTESDVKFIEKLEEALSENKITNDLDWWLFSRINEYLDEVYIPYHDPSRNLMRKFYPDFIFWLCRDNNYFIIFVDPKGIKFTEYEFKIDGFTRIFGEINNPRSFEYGSFNIRVLLLLYNIGGRQVISKKYRDYWIDDVESIFTQIDKIPNE
ncbi:MAG: DEAD/DEAH box helicase family protein [Candidatus Hermodarchaeota archaeon]